MLRGRMLPGSVSQPPLWHPWLLRHSFCSSVLSYCLAFCPDPWALLHGTHWCLRQGYGRNWLQIFPFLSAGSPGCVVGFFVSPNQPPKLTGFWPFEALITYSDLFECTLSVICWVLEVQFIISREEVWEIPPPFFWHLFIKEILVLVRNFKIWVCIMLLGNLNEERGTGTPPGDSCVRNPFWIFVVAIPDPKAKCFLKVQKGFS